MKRFETYVFCLLACLVALCAGCEKEPATARQPASGGNGSLTIEYKVFPSILMEAESGEVTAPMAIFEDAESAGGKYVMAPEGPEHKEISIGGDVTFRFNVTEPGEYVFWLRAKWCCSCGDSVGVVMDGVELSPVQDPVHGEWHWVALERRRLQLTAGEHVLVITNREDGAAVDQILLTQDPDYRPTGIESADVNGRISFPSAVCVRARRASRT